MINFASDIHTHEIWAPAINPETCIKVVEEAMTMYQREELNQDQARCWGMIKDLFLYRINRLIKNNLFQEREVKYIGNDLAARCEALFSIKEKAFDNFEKIRLVFHNAFGISIGSSHETSILEPDYIAPDGSQIFLISNHVGYGLARCKLPQGATSIPACHKTVTEVWTIESGSLELYCRDREQENVSLLNENDQREIYPDTHFQFRTIGEDSVSVLIRTSPVWPGAEEVVNAQGLWMPTVQNR